MVKWREKYLEERENLRIFLGKQYFNSFMVSRSNRSKQGCMKGAARCANVGGANVRGVGG